MNKTILKKLIIRMGKFQLKMFVTQNLILYTQHIALKHSALTLLKKECHASTSSLKFLFAGSWLGKDYLAF